MRVSYVKNGNDLQIMDRNDYYPFGMSFLKPFGQSSVYDPMAIPYNYKFGSKELQEFGGYDFGARIYSPDAPHWWQIDPLTEETSEWSPYAYGFNNPIRFTDPTGMSNEDWVKRGNQIFFDPSVKGNAEVKAAYGDNAQSITGYHVTQNDVTTHYNLGDDGSITTTVGSLNFLSSTQSVYDSNNIETGAATILGMGGNDSSSIPTIGSPSPFQGKSTFDILMVDTNPVMPALASAVCPPCGYAAGAATAANDFSEGNYISGTIGAATLAASSKFGSSFVHGEYEVMTSGLPKNGKFQYGVKNSETNFQFRFERHRLQTAEGGEKAVHFNYGVQGDKHFFPVNASKYRPYVKQ